MRNDSAHQYTDAIAILPGDSDYPPTANYTGVVYDQPDYTAAETLPPGVSALRGYRGAWWLFVVDHHGAPPPTLYAFGWDVGVYLDVWRAEAPGWVLVAQAGPTTNDDNTAELTGFQAGTTYYARVGTVTDTDNDSVWLCGYGLFVRDPGATTTGGGTGTGGTGTGGTTGSGGTTGGGTTGGGTTGGGTTGGGTTGGGGTTTGGGGTTTGGGGATVMALDAGPAGVGVDAGAPMTNTDTADAVSPSGVSVPGRRPAFIVAVTVERPGQQVQVQWSTDPTFRTVAGTAATDAPAGLDGAQVAVQPDADIADGVIYWRARITGAYGPGPFGDPAHFALNSAEGQGVAAGELTVAAGGAPAAPHLWYIDYDETGTDTGQPAVIIGTGFGPAPAVWLGELPCTVTEVLDVPADPSHATAPRIIPGLACTPAHQQIRFLIPAVDPDHVGDALTVHREG